MAKHFRLYLLLTVLAVFVFTSSVAIWAFYQADELIYKPFTKIDVLSEGLGLGLPLSKRHALSLGGDLVYDKSYHDGCRFILEIPK